MEDKLLYKLINTKRIGNCCICKRNAPLFEVVDPENEGDFYCKLCAIKAASYIMTCLQTHLKDKHVLQVFVGDESELNIQTKEE